MFEQKLIVVLTLGLSGFLQGQAPGDGDETCISETINGENNPFFDNHPVYLPTERPLMDSRDYVALLDEGTGVYTPWQHVDVDNTTSTDTTTHWFQSGTSTCQVQLTSCAFDVGAQENWLITQHINTVLPGGERLRKVTVQFEGTLDGCDITNQCKQIFEVYKWQTSIIDRTAAANTNNYVHVGRVSPANTDGSSSFTEYQDIELDDESGLYLAVVDLSTCVTMTRILVLYNACPAEMSELISRPEAPDFGHSVSVTGQCVENSSTVTGTAPVLTCGSRGEWQVIVGCLCDPGYQLNSTLDRCEECGEGRFSGGVGNEACETCPANSEGTGTGLTVCPCLQNYYRAPYENSSDGCTQYPGAPSNLMVSNVTNTSVVLSWSPPVNGGGRPLSEIFYTITATDTSGVIINVTGDNETIVTGLTPFINYTFSVTAENDVSSQDNNINIRTISTTMITAIGVGGVVTEIELGEDGVLRWSAPVPSNGHILYYNVIITRADTGELVVRIDQLNDLYIDLLEYYNEGNVYNILIQSVTVVGGGDFSIPMTVHLVKQTVPPEIIFNTSVRVINPNDSHTIINTDSSTTAAITSSIVVVITMLILVLLSFLGHYFFWKRHQGISQNVGSINTVIEVPNIASPSEAFLTLQANEAYEKVEATTNS